MNVKILIYFLLLSFFVSCDSSNDADLDKLKKENLELKEALANNATIAKVDFTDTEMILTYSNGLKVSTSIPDVLRGENGESPRIGDNGNWWIGDTDTGVIAKANDGINPHIGDNGNWWVADTDTGVIASGADGIDGVGIKSISYDSETGLMTIILTNSTESKFVILNNNGSLSANIMKDLDGKYLVSKISMGDITFGEFEYNADNQLIKLTSYNADGYSMFKSLQIEKIYTNGLTSEIITKKYASEKIVRYTDVGYLDEYIVKEDKRTEEVLLTVDKGSEFFETESDGSLYCYQKGSYSDSAKIYYYDKYLVVVEKRLDNELLKKDDGSYDFYKRCSGVQCFYKIDGRYVKSFMYKIYNNCYPFNDNYSRVKSIKISDGIFNIYSKSNVNTTTFSQPVMVNGEYENYIMFTLDYKRTIDGVYEIGDLCSETFVTLEYDSDGILVKTFSKSQKDASPEMYTEYFYDSNNIAKTQVYISVDGNWEKKDTFILFNYNNSNLLSEFVRVDDKGVKTTISKIIYDQEGNPTELFRLLGDVYNDPYSNEIINPETGLYEYYEDFIIHKGGLYSFAKIEYNYKMKNFFGNTFSCIIPELTDLKYNNAISRVVISNSINAGNIEYSDFNDGGYPTTMSFIGGGSVGSYSGQLKVEYIKIQ